MADHSDIKEILKQLEPILGKQVERLWHTYLATDPGADRQDLEVTLRILAERAAKLGYRDPIRLPPPGPSDLEGPYRLGRVLYPDVEFADFGLRDEELVRHTLIVGITGAGKTNLSFQLLRQFAQHHKPFLVFDWKRSYRALRSFPELQDLTVIRLGTELPELKFNPLIPPAGTHPRIWMTLLVDVISHVFFIGHGVEYFLRKAIDALYGSFGVYEGRQEFPTFADVDAYLKKEFVRGREMLWMSSTKRVLAMLTPGSVLWDTLNTRTASDLDALLSKPVVIEMDNLAVLEKILVVETMLLWIYLYRKAQGRAISFRHALVVEEAHHVLSGSKETKLGSETIMELIIRMIREFGEGVIVIDQEPSKLSKSVLANTNCKISFNLGSGTDIRTMQSAMALGESGKDVIDQLKIGHALVKLKDRFTDPIHVRIPLVDPRSHQTTD